MPYALKYDNGRSDEYTTHAEAAEAFREECPDGWVGHDGDLTDGGDRTLCWPDEEASENDDGANAVAEIVRVSE